MATVNQNGVSYGVVSSGFAQCHLPVDNSDTPVKAGELVYLDSSSHILKPLVDGSAALYCGMALQPSAINSNIDLSTAPAIKSVMVAGKGCVANFKTTASETYYPGTAVYVGADAQTITTVDPGSGKIVGRVILPTGVASVTGATGVNVPVILQPQIILT